MVPLAVQVADLTLLHTSEGEPGGHGKHLVATEGASLSEQICVLCGSALLFGGHSAAENTVPSTLLHSAQPSCQETE